MYHQFNIQQFYVLPTQRIYVFCVDLRTNSDYFPIQHKLIVFYNRDLTLYSPVVTIRTTSFTFNNSTFYPHSVFMCFVWLSEQIATISLYSIDWLDFIIETDCVYCAVRTGSLYTNHVDRQCFLQIHRFSTVSIIQSKHHRNLHLHAGIVRMNGRRLGTLQKQSSVGSRGALDKQAHL